MGEFTERLRKDDDLSARIEAANIIDELENPSDETIDAMGKAINDSDYGALRYEVPDEELLRIFKAMVCSVLERLK